MTAVHDARGDDRIESREREHRRILRPAPQQNERAENGERRDPLEHQARGPLVLIGNLHHAGRQPRPHRPIHRLDVVVAAARAEVVRVVREVLRGADVRARVVRSDDPTVDRVRPNVVRRSRRHGNRDGHHDRRCGEHHPARERRPLRLPVQQEEERPCCDREQERERPRWDPLPGDHDPRGRRRRYDEQDQRRSSASGARADGCEAQHGVKG